MKRAIGQPGFAASVRRATSNNLLAPAPAFQPSGNTPRPQVICLLSANPRHNAFRGGTARAYSGWPRSPRLPDIIRWFGMASGRCRSAFVRLTSTIQGNNKRYQAVSTHSPTFEGECGPVPYATIRAAKAPCDWPASSSLGGDWTTRQSPAFTSFKKALGPTCDERRPYRSIRKTAQP